MKYLIALTFLLELNIGWSQNDSTLVKTQLSTYDSVITNYFQRNSLNPATVGIFKRPNFQSNMPRFLHIISLYG